MIIRKLQSNRILPSNFILSARKYYYRHIAIVEIRDMPDGTAKIWHIGYHGYTRDDGRIVIYSGLFEAIVFYNGFLTEV